MINRELAQIFYEIADFLEMEKVAFKPQAYRKAAIILENLEQDIAKIYKEEGRRGLLKISGIGEGIADKIEEYIKSRKIKYYQSLKKKTPIKVEELTAVEGLGPKKVKVLYEKLAIRNIKDLERAAKDHKIASLPGFGEKTEKNILEGIEFLKKNKGRFLLGEILPRVKEIQSRLEKLKEIKQVSVAGSVRRMKETIGDVDFLVVSRSNKGGSSQQAAKKIMDYFVSLPGVVKVWGKGMTKSSVRLKEGFDVDVRVVPLKSYGSALQYFTGSKEHNIVIRKIAMDKGLKLSEYGLFRGSKMIAGKTEEEIYEALDMDWLPPEIRENQGEIEAALSHKLPKLIDYNDIKGDLHCHSNWDGGMNSIEEMARMAITLGYEYIGISDHTKFLRIEKGLNEKQLLLQRKEIDRLNSRFENQKLKFKVLQGCEANILNDGSIDIKDEVLAKLDYVIAGVHSNLKMPKEKMTERIIKAMENPNVDIISHPMGRLLQRRDEYQIDFDKILKTAKKTGTILEINSSPERLDLNDQNVRKAKEEGVKMIINTDSHHKEHLKFIELGISQARRGWAEKEDIVNTHSLEKLIKFFKS